MHEAVWSTDLAGLPPPRRGKVRDVYDLGETLLLVATDRLSAYDHVLRPAIPGKGKVLTQLSSYWFARLGEVVPNHLLAPPISPPPSGRTRRCSPGARCWCARRMWCRSNASRAAILPAAAFASTAKAAASAASSCRRGWRWPAGCRGRSSPPRRRPKQATTRTSTSPPLRAA